MLHTTYAVLALLAYLLLLSHYARRPRDRHFIAYIFLSVAAVCLLGACLMEQPPAQLRLEQKDRERLTKEAKDEKRVRVIIDPGKGNADRKEKKDDEKAKVDAMNLVR